MNPVERVARRLDAAQQRSTPIAFVVGVVKKYTDDNGGVMAAALAHSAFVSIFPLLLVFVTILGLVAASDPALRAPVLTGQGAAFAGISHQFPIIGRQLTSNVHALRRSSTIGLIVGLLATIWGCTGLAQSVWAAAVYPATSVPSRSKNAPTPGPSGPASTSATGPESRADR
jgi:uncharacterized BrkB/YihY/UPF0761 family membrane protein